MYIHIYIYISCQSQFQMVLYVNSFLCGAVLTGRRGDQECVFALENASFVVGST